MTPRQSLSPGLDLPRHRHAGAYAAVVLSGGYEEAGDTGRRRLAPGDVVLHGAFEAHLDRAGPGGAQVLNLPLAALTQPGFALAADPDALVRAAERDPVEAGRQLLATLVPATPHTLDWTDDLAAALTADPGLRLTPWAHVRRLDPATVSRGFRRTFGTTPARFRLEVRARQAWRRLATTADGLADLAMDCGFADQAHMTRAVTALTGRPPGAWRVKSVQDRR
jgi:AraC-like DNA-binding protein